MPNFPSKNIAVIWKRTKYELDLQTYGSLQAYKEVCKEFPWMFTRAYNSHLRQVSSRLELQNKIFPNAHFFFREEWEDNKSPSDFDLIIAHGGDNHFTYVAHIAGKAPLVGVNSDPDSSVGALLGFNASTIKKAVESNFASAKWERWSLLETEILYPNGTKLKTVPAVCEISIRNNSPDLTSRYCISYQGKVEEQKCSGLLLHTGAGSTGWVRSCFPKKFPTFGKEEEFFQVYSREIRAKSDGLEFSLADFQAFGEVEVISEMEGGIAIDSLTERQYPFPPFSKATIRLSKEKLNVLVPQG